ncbi:MAG: hypothetical protein WBW41_19800, partial [Verrucomicrobiia bacterium]
SRVEGGRSPLGRFGKCEACRSATYVTKNTKKSGNRSASMKFRIGHDCPFELGVDFSTNFLKSEISNLEFPES